MSTKFERVWAMPSKWTFTIKPIKSLLDEYTNEGVWIDPFAGRNSPASITNDLNPDAKATYNLDALDFLHGLKNNSADGVLFDPPYSVRQLAECYKSVGIAVTQETTRPNFWTNIKVEIARVLKPGGVVISFGWNSGGVGKTLGMELERVLLVPHGGIHHDTIVTVERKVMSQPTLLAAE